MPPRQLRQSRNVFKELKSVLQQTYEPQQEIQASAPFYVPFLVSLVRPGYSLDKICNALKTHTLGQREFERFNRAHESKKLQPCLLDTLGDYRTPKIKVNPCAITNLSDIHTSCSQSAAGDHDDINPNAIL